MKRTTLAVFALLTVVPSTLWADEFFGLEVPPDSDVVAEEDGRVELEVNLSHDEVVAFYEGVLEKHEDIKVFDREESSQFTDHGNLQWHSITVQKKQREEKTTVVILEDSWSWILSTLVFRYIGVFGVIIVLFVSMSLSGSLISWTIKRLETRSGRASTQTPTHSREQDSRERAKVAIAAAAVREFENSKRGEG